MFGRKGTRDTKPWEYKVQEANVPLTTNRFIELENTLNKMGQQGWELASASFHTEAKETAIMIFKRPKINLSVAFLKQPRQKL